MKIDQKWSWKKNVSKTWCCTAVKQEKRISFNAVIIQFCFQCVRMKMNNISTYIKWRSLLLLTYFDNSALCCVLCFFSRAWFYFQSFDLLITIVLKNCNCVNCFLIGNLYFNKFKLINLNITVFRGSGYVSYLGVSPHFGSS